MERHCLLPFYVSHICILVFTISPEFGWIMLAVYVHSYICKIRRIIEERKCWRSRPAPISWDDSNYHPHSCMLFYHYHHHHYIWCACIRPRFLPMCVIFSRLIFCHRSFAESHISYHSRISIFGRLTSPSPPYNTIYLHNRTPYGYEVRLR